MTTTDGEGIDLGKFEGLPITSVGVEIPNAGGGLQESLKIDPRLLSVGDEVDIVLRCRVGKVRHERARGSKEDPEPDELRRVSILHAATALIADDAVVADLLDEQAERIVLAREAEEGVQRLALEDEERALAESESDD